VKSVKLNGKPHRSPFISHDDVMTGGELIFEMSAKPVKWFQSF
jgi:putative alpha-1,2-mannosidase